MLRSAIGRLRAAGMVEGASFLLLLFVAMPLKYVWGRPEAVSVIGMAHGVLFLLYCLLLVFAWDAAKWNVRQCAKAFVAALIPFGPFLIDGWLRREDKRLQGSEATPDAEAA